MKESERLKPEMKTNNFGIKERKIGEVFKEISGIQLIVVKRKNCKGCFYEFKACDDSEDTLTGCCWSGSRSDHKDVLFIPF